MPSNLDKTHDEIIRDNRASPSRGGGGFRRRGHGGAASSGPGPVRRSSTRRHSPPFWPDKAPDTRWEHDLYDENQPDRSTARFTAGPVRRSSTRPHSLPFWSVKVPETRWEHDLYYENQLDVRVRAPQGFPNQAAPSTTISDLETETKLCISNLDFNISIKKIGELISEVGGWKKYSLHCDESGESRVRAEVVYSRRRDAEEAMEKYNNVELDGKPMKIKIVGGNVSTPAHPPAPVAGSSVDPDWAPRAGQGLGREQGRRQGRNLREAVTVEELDADLDRYRSEAMQID